MTNRLESASGGGERRDKFGQVVAQGKAFAGACVGHDPGDVCEVCATTWPPPATATDRVAALEARVRGLDSAIYRIVSLGLGRCSSGWGKYPLGVRDALRELEPLMDEAMRKALHDFDGRLAR